MTKAIATTEPANIIAGDTAKWVKSLADYPASAGWGLVYTFINAAGKFTLTASAQGDDFLIVAAANTSAAWLPGEYQWRAQVSKAGEVYTVASGRTVVAPSFGAATLDGRSEARKMLEAIEATLGGRASSATAEYEIQGRSLKYIPIPELLQLRDRLRADVVREDAAAAAAAGLPSRSRIQVRFGA